MPRTYQKAPLPFFATRTTAAVANRVAAAGRARATERTTAAQRGGRLAPHTSQVESRAARVVAERISQLEAQATVTEEALDALTRKNARLKKRTAANIQEAKQTLADTVAEELIRVESGLDGRLQEAQAVAHKEMGRLRQQLQAVHRNTRSLVSNERSRREKTTRRGNKQIARDFNSLKSVVKSHHRNLDRMRLEFRELAELKTRAEVQQR